MGRTKNHARLILAVAGLVALFTSQATKTRAAGTASVVQVTVAGGRVIRAAVDSRTDAETLWLRFDRETAVLYRPIRWSRIVRVLGAGQTFSSDAFRQVADQWKSDRSEILNESTVTEDPSPMDVDATKLTSGATYAERAQEALAASPRVASIALDAYVANWDNDPEVDGLMVVVTALDPKGQLVEVDGTLDVELLADRRSYLKPQPLRRRQQFNRLGRWTNNMPIERGGQMAFRLPFQAINPQFDPDVASSAFVVGTLSVPGHGVFQATATDVRIRPISNLRDQLEYATGSRYLPTERTR